MFSVHQLELSGVFYDFGTYDFVTRLLQMRVDILYILLFSYIWSGIIHY